VKELWWSTNQEHKYIPPPAVGKTGMSKTRFDDLHSCVRYCDQPPERPATMSSEPYRWRLRDDFVRRFNEHRLQTFSSSDVVCVDEPMSKCYGAGGNVSTKACQCRLLSIGSPRMAAKKARGRSGVMLPLKLVTTAEDASQHAEAASSGLLHCTNVSKELVMPWARAGDIVAADSSLASVASAEEL
jgi:Transposase IS4